MFLPVRKNLHIGLGLVNCVNISEFKAVLAHEFGHFSQDSMKLGSYVYNMNQIIYNLLYDNEAYHRALQRWGEFSNYFALFATLTMAIVRGIQWLLQRIYSIVNKQYLSLSRQMEFHADTVSASVSGGNHLISSLRRLEVADFTFQRVLGFYQRFKKEKLKPENIYTQQVVAMKTFAKHHGLPLELGLPQVDGSSFARFNRSRLVVKDQWASHPSNDDREHHLKSLNIQTPANPRHAWTVFIKSEALQKQMTEKLVQQMQLNGEVTVNENAFAERMQKEIDKYELPPEYKGFYDDRNFYVSGLDGIEAAHVQAETIDSILTNEVLELPHLLNGIATDLNALQIIHEESHINQFEFSGIKYRKSDAAQLLEKLRAEEQLVKQQLEQTDRKIIAWFIQKATAAGRRDLLESKYHEVFSLTSESEEDAKIYNDVQFRLVSTVPGYAIRPDHPCCREIEVK